MPGRASDTHEERQAFTGLEFGRRSTKTVCARIYDKTRQIEREGNDWWHTVWGEAFDPARPVLRVEFELGRQGLVEYGIHSPIEGIDQASRLWASVSEDWLSYRVRSDDQTRSRWPTAPAWQFLQQASLRDAAIGLERVRAGKRQGDLRRLVPLVVGYLATTGAVLGLDDLDSVLGALRFLVSEDEKRRGTTFDLRVASKIAERRPS